MKQVTKQVIRLSPAEQVASMLLRVPGAQIKYTFLGNFPRLGSKRDEKVSIEIHRFDKRRKAPEVTLIPIANLALDKTGYPQDLLLAGKALERVGFLVASVDKETSEVFPHRITLQKNDQLVAELRYSHPRVVDSKQ